MTDPSLQPQHSLHLLNTMKLPRLGGEPGPLHTLVQDQQQNIYYSDEINHSVVSLDSSGELRWHHTKLGKQQGEFHYPKGIDWGWIDWNGCKTECLAVCDSWNNRIQFFNRHGGYLTTWSQIADIPLCDVVDIRFLEIDSEPARWLVLDRGHHSLFGMDPSGNFLFRIGRPLPDNLESRWPTPFDHQDIQSSSLGALHACLPYDPLFMPSRLFGSTPDALYVWEPISRQLKQVAFGNLIPTWIGLPPGADWIGADKRGLLAFSAASGLLRAYEWASGVWRTASIEGIPVFSRCSNKQAWIQNGNFLSRQTLKQDEAIDLIPETKHSQICELQKLGREIENKFDSKCAFEEIPELKQLAARLLLLGEKAVARMNSDGSECETPPAIEKNLMLFLQDFSTAITRLKSRSSLFLLVILKTHEAHNCCGVNSITEFMNRAALPIFDAVRDMTNIFDELLRYRDEWFLAFAANRNAAAPAEELCDQLRSLIETLMTVTMSTMAKILDYTWHAPAWEKLIAPARVQEKMQEPASRHARLWKRLDQPGLSFGQSSRYFRELDRIYLGGQDLPNPVRPATIAHFNNNHLLVALQDASQIISLDEQGKVLKRFERGTNGEILFQQPVGIATDSKGCIWISEPLNNCIKIFNPCNNALATLDQFACRPIGFNYPIGIFRANDGRMFIADTYNNRILTAEVSGEIKVFLDQAGKKPGEWRNPVSFCASDSHDTIWVVDHRNHRLQKLDLNGTPLQQIGGDGPQRDRILAPEFAVRFDDGMMVVQERAYLRALRLFSSQGEEMETIYLDYAPRGILIHNGRLCVCAWSGDHVYVYERI